MIPNERVLIVVFLVMRVDVTAHITVTVMDEETRPEIRLRRQTLFNLFKLDLSPRRAFKFNQTEKSRKQMDPHRAMPLMHAGAAVAFIIISFITIAVAISD